ISTISILPTQEQKSKQITPIIEQDIQGADTQKQKQDNECQYQEDDDKQNEKNTNNSQENQTNIYQNKSDENDYFVYNFRTDYCLDYQNGKCPFNSFMCFWAH